MYTVCVIKSKDNRLYKGITNNLDRRLKEHKRGKTKTTKSMNDLRIIYTEQFDSFEQAREREKYLKTATGRRFLKNILCTRSSVG